MKEFLWGVASSSFQSEGSCENDMTQWEAEGRFKKDGKNPVYSNGANHWKLWEQDFELLKELNVNAYRFSVEWSRIEPQPGYFDEKVIKQYGQMIDRLIQLNITPVLTLHHFSHPAWFHNYSPWTSKDSVHVFYRFAKMIIRRYAEKVPFWISFNEPLVWALAAYGDAQFPPGEKNPQAVMQALHNMLLTHKEIYNLLKTYNPDARMGIAKHFIVFKGQRSWFPPDRGLANRLDFFFNRMVPEAFKTNRLKFSFWPILNYDQPIDLDDQIDFWGINYYYRLHSHLRLSLKNPLNLTHKNPQTDMGWEIYPKGLKKILQVVDFYGKDVLITENGIATENDALRDKFIRDHVSEMRKWQSANKNILGYFYWSFLDNYEWLEGKSKRFGLVHVDYADRFKRTLKPSARFFKQLR